MISRPAGYGIAAIVLCTVLACGSAGAQEVAAPAACQQYRAELSALQRGSPNTQRYAAAAQRQRSELDRTRGYYQQLGCDRGGFFGGGRPAECGGLQSRMQQMQANLDMLRGRASGSDPQLEGRRRELAAAMASACAPRTAARQRGFFELLFGGGRPEEAPPQADLDGQVPPSHQPDGERQRFGGSRAVCVRLADGYFFPLGGPASGRGGAQELCQAQCPASPTELYFMSPAGNIEQAVSATGRPYIDLPTASQYERTLSPEVSCRQPGQSWAQALQGAEQLLDGRKSDIIVTAEKAEELSRPKATGATKGSKSSAAANADTKPDEADPDSEAPSDPSAVPTASGDSSGIGPQSIAGEATMDRGQGTMREEVGPDGQRRKVRIVAPYLVAGPQNATLIDPRRGSASN
jgi:hypothetical protein